MKIQVKYMVSSSCKEVVKNEITKLGLHCTSVDLGEIDLLEDISQHHRESLNQSLLPFGLELLSDKKAILVEKIKNVIIELISLEHDFPKIKFSDYLSQTLRYNYTYLSNLFSANQPNTIVDFMITQKIERAKQLLTYNQLNLTEISWKLRYSSVAHLSYQFKKITGLTPSVYKSMKLKDRCLANA